MPDPGQASLGMEGTDPGESWGKRWRGKQTCVLVTWAGWDVWPHLNTKTPRHLGHGAGIPVPHGVPEVVVVHGSSAGRDWAHPSLWLASHPAGLPGAVAGSACHGHLGHLAQPWQPLDPSIGPWTWWPTCKWHCLPRPQHPAQDCHHLWDLSPSCGVGVMPGCDAEGGRRAKNKVELLLGPLSHLLITAG